MNTILSRFTKQSHELKQPVEEDDTYLNLAEMTTTIKIFLEKNGFTYKTIHSCNDIQILYQLIKNDDRNRVSKLSTNVKYIAGLYFELIHDVKAMMEQYLEGVDLGCSECMNLLGRYYYRNKDYTQMMAFWEMAINKKNIEAIFNLSKYFEDEKQYDKMIHALKMAIEMGSEKAVLSLALYYQKNKEFEKMIEIYRQGVHNGYTSCMIELGNYYMSLGDKENTIKYYSAGAKTNPEAMYLLGIFYESRKEYSKMIEYYNLAIHQNHTGSMIRLGDYYKRIKNYDLMIYIYKMAAQTNPEVMNKLGLHYQKKKQISEMMRYYESAIKLGCVNAMNNLAIYYESIGQYEKMKILLEKAIEKKSSVAMYNMGLYYEKIKDYDKMAEYFMMSYRNGRVFDYSEIKLMKKSILHVSKPKLMDDLKKMISDKKKQFKEMFTFNRSKEKSSKRTLDLKKDMVKQKSQYKLSKENKKPQNLIEIPNDEKPMKSLFTDVELYKIIGNIDQNTKDTAVTTSQSHKDWIMDLDPIPSPVLSSHVPQSHVPQSHVPSHPVLSTPVLSPIPFSVNNYVGKDVMTTKDVPDSRMGSGSPELNMYRMFVGLHK